MDLRRPNNCQPLEGVRSFVMIFAPDGQTRNDIEAALRDYTSFAQFVDVPSAIHAEPIEDAEQLPLWRWFVSSK